MAEAEGERRGRLDAGRGGVRVRVQHGGEAEEEQREQAGRQEGDERCQVGGGHRSHQCAAQGRPLFRKSQQNLHQPPRPMEYQPN